MEMIKNLVNNIVNNKNIIYNEYKELNLIKFKNLSSYKSLITHCFTTRTGGVSKDEYSSLNLGFKNNDKRENVIENFKRVCGSLNININDIVLSDQIHNNRIKIVDTNDKGKGISVKSSIKGYDGLATNCKGVILTTFYADCVPIYFLDPVKEVIAISHSGWKGTTMGIGPETVKVLKHNFGCNPKNLKIAIGPSIGECCFEVEKNVYKNFKEKYEWIDNYCTQTKLNKWHIDLQSIIIKTLISEGCLKQNILSCGICTCCNNDIFFSYRGDKGKTGSLAGMIQLNY